MSLEKEFVPYQPSLDMKELGFDEPCFVYWVFDGVETTLSTSHNKSGWSMIGFKNNQMVKKAGLCTAPTYSQAFRWFREKYKLYSHVRESYSFDNTLEFVTQINGSYVNHGIFDKPVNRFETHEEAEQACLDKLIEIVKQK